MNQSRSGCEVWKELSPRFNVIRKYLDHSNPVLEGPVKMYDAGKMKDRYLILSGHALFIGKKVSKRTIHYKKGIYLNQYRDVDVVTNSTYSVPNVEFRVYHPNVTFTFFAPSVYERDVWVQRIRESMK
jgi:hypothetical protein